MVKRLLGGLHRRSRLKIKTVVSSTEVCEINLADCPFQVLLDSLSILGDKLAVFVDRCDSVAPFPYHSIAIPTYWIQRMVGSKSRTVNTYDFDV